MQQQILYVSVHMMPLGLLRCVITWFSSHLSEGESQSILNTIKEMHPGFSVKELYALQIKNKVTYQLLAGQRKGLFVKKWKHMRLMNFETDGKFIDEIEL